MRMLKFGGPNLPEGTSTWYDTPSPAKKGEYVQVRAEPGLIVPADHVMKFAGADERGAAKLEPNADYYVASGRAEFAEESAPASAPARAKPKE
jgi:hypothetical protein